MSSSDIISRVWTGILKVEFQIDSTQIPSTNNSFFTVLNRNSYLHLLMPDILAFFNISMDDFPIENWWFEYDGVPLKWNLPAGVLYDSSHPYTRKEDEDTTSDVWTIRMKYGDYPSAYVIPIEHIDADRPTDWLESCDFPFLKSHWMNQMKEACYILNNSSKIMMSMSKERSDFFYRSVVNNDSRVFESCFRKLLPTTISQIHNIPIKIHLPLANKVVRPSLNGVSSKLTLGKMLQQLIPDLFPSNMMMTIAVPISHGVILPLDASVIHLYTLLKYVDGFLHINVHMLERGSA